MLARDEGRLTFDGSLIHSLFSKSPCTAVYEFRLAVTITLAHTSLRHSSFLNSPSERSCGHISVPTHDGAMLRMVGKFSANVRVRQLHPPA